MSQGDQVIIPSFLSISLIRIKTKSKQANGKPHYFRKVEALLEQGRALKKLVSKMSEKDTRFEQLWEALVEEGDDLQDLLATKPRRVGQKRKWAESLNAQFKIYGQLVQTSRRALDLMEKSEETKAKLADRLFIHETLKKRFDRSEKNLTELMNRGASGESGEGEKKEHKRLWIKRLNRALDEHELAEDGLSNDLLLAAKKVIFV